MKQLLQLIALSLIFFNNAGASCNPSQWSQQSSSHKPTATPHKVRPSIFLPFRESTSGEPTAQTVMCAIIAFPTTRLATIQSDRISDAKKRSQKAEPCCISTIQETMHRLESSIQRAQECISICQTYPVTKEYAQEISMSWTIARANLDILRKILCCDQYIENCKDIACNDTVKKLTIESMEVLKSCLSIRKHGSHYQSLVAIPMIEPLALIADAISEEA